MSEYFLGDKRAEERARQRDFKKKDASTPDSQNVKATLLGDFLVPSLEPHGGDPYNSTPGNRADAWGSRRR